MTTRYVQRHIDPSRRSICIFIGRSLLIQRQNAISQASHIAVTDGIIAPAFDKEAQDLKFEFEQVLDALSLRNARELQEGNKEKPSRLCAVSSGLGEQCEQSAVSKLINLSDFSIAKILDGLSSSSVMECTAYQIRAIRSPIFLLFVFLRRPVRLVSVLCSLSENSHYRPCL
jgi:hypothetical protein